MLISSFSSNLKFKSNTLAATKPPFKNKKKGIGIHVWKNTPNFQIPIVA
jgi:hypothetical protein